MVLGVDEASQAYERAMRNIAAAGPGVCRVCWGFIDPDYETCYKWGHQPDCLDAMVPITYSEHLGRRGSRIRGVFGCHVVLDDFGTGFGSFTTSSTLPARFLKIDMELVRDMAASPTDRQVVKSITDVAHSLSKQTVAEGWRTATRCAPCASTASTAPGVSSSAGPSGSPRPPTSSAGCCPAAARREIARPQGG
jgi:EAL domain